jgi:hypothetical protein
MPLRQPPNVAASTPRRHHDDDDNNSYRPYNTRRIQILQRLNISASLSRRLYEDAVKTSRHLHNDKRHAISLTAKRFSHRHHDALPTPPINYHTTRTQLTARTIANRQTFPHCHPVVLQMTSNKHFAD